MTDFLCASCLYNQASFENKHMYKSTLYYKVKQPDLTYKYFELFLFGVAKSHPVTTVPHCKRR